MLDGHYRSDSIAILALLDTRGVGYVAVSEALTAAQAIGITLSELLEMPRRRLLEILPARCAGTASTIASCGPANVARAERLVERVLAAGGLVIPATAPEFPDKLRQCLRNQCPPLLFAAGHSALSEAPSVAVVGTRTPSVQGKDLAEQCATLFAGHGTIVVSGGAQGVDMAAHLATLEAGGGTIVILPQGLLSFRPTPELGRGLEDGRVLLLSEFAPDAAWQTHAAVTRNATISALSGMVCVIEPQKVGGSIRTARLALAQGKRVLVHVAKGMDCVWQTLASGGAEAVCNADGMFDPDRLLQAFAEGKVKPAQGLLSFY